MLSIAKPFAGSLAFTDFTFDLVTGDLTDTQARRRARADGGPSIAWIAGHLAHYRHIMLALLGHPRESPFARQFGEAGATDGADYPSLDDIRAQWSTLSAALQAALESASEETLLAETGGPHGEKTALERFVFYVWHEAYHMGQLGTLRAQFGLPATATLAMEAAKTSAKS